MLKITQPSEYSAKRGAMKDVFIFRFHDHVIDINSGFFLRIQRLIPCKVYLQNKNQKKKISKRNIATKQIDSNWRVNETPQFNTDQNKSNRKNS